MEYHVNFQYRPTDAIRPEDEPMRVTIKSTEGGLLLIPNIGDHVSFVRAGAGNQSQQITGVVENRLFLYLAQDVCSVNIVVTDSDTDSGKLIKE